MQTESAEIYSTNNLSTNQADRNWRLGDVTVNRIGFGTKRLADRDEAAGIIRRAIELGVNHIDTAAFYPTVASRQQDARVLNDFTAHGWANDAIRHALAPYSGDLVIATKVGPTDHGMARPDELRGLVEENLRHLGRDDLDLVYLRQHGLESIAEHFGVLAEMRQAGLIRRLGISNVRPHHLDQALEIAPVVSVQNRYGIEFGRVNDELVRVCGERGIAFVPFFALAATGREAGGVAESEAVSTVAREAGATPAQVRIAWTLSRGRHVLAIPGTSNPDHLAENLKAMDVELSTDQLARLDAATD